VTCAFDVSRASTAAASTRFCPRAVSQLRAALSATCRRTSSLVARCASADFDARHHCASRFGASGTASSRLAFTESWASATLPLIRRLASRCVYVPLPYSEGSDGARAWPTMAHARSTSSSAMRRAG